MAVSKLNPSAQPFFCPNPQRHLPPPPPPPPMPLCHAVACPPPFSFVTTNYPCAPFPVTAPHYPLPPAPPPPPPFLCKRVPFLPAPLHGRPPHKLTVPRSAVAAEKIRAQAQAAAKARAAADVKAVQEPPAPPAARRPRRAVALAAARGPRDLHQQVVIARSKNHIPRKAAPVTRSWSTARPPPSESAATGPREPCPAPQAKDARLRTSDTTVMVRNIPNKLTFGDMMRFLDEHCARMNQQRGAPLAYDFLYVPIDFRMSSGHRSSNYGYAFVNLTTPKAARRMQRSLSGFHWKFVGSQKVIETCRAKIQGKDALEERLSHITFTCHTDEFLPAVFSPPRAGASAGDTKPPKRIGKRVPRQAAQDAAVKPSS